MTERQRRAARGNDATGPDRETARRSLMPQRKGQAEEAAQEERSPAPAEGPGRKDRGVHAVRIWPEHRPHGDNGLEPGIVHRDLPARTGFQPGPDAGMGGGPHLLLLLHHAGIGLTQQDLGRHGAVIRARQAKGKL